ncbi:hypothetical protein GH742_04580 [Legionella sp. MW5194]|uniref:hypothetical protein n=1 Tax=Legionella sp. MW5194 TaxID=2662448 RepID=UPI00193D8CCC|nr:hypothetical protein [Legionella sp. MW5194]QRN03200.1 hypothetical protein GH742_04580 [Legionella sp. MW5194]
MKTNQPNQDGKSEQTVEPLSKPMPKSWSQLQLLLHQIITAEKADYVIDILGVLGAHLFHLAALSEKKFIASNINPGFRERIAAIEKTDIDSLLKAGIMPLTPLANPDSMELRKDMLVFEKEVLKKKTILFENAEGTKEIIDSYDPKNFYILPLTHLSTEAATKMLAQFQNKKCPYLAVHQAKLDDPMPFAVQGGACFDFLDFSSSTRWFLYTKSSVAKDIKAFCLKAYVDNEQATRVRIDSIQSRLKTMTDANQIPRLEKQLQEATEVLNFIKRSYENSPLNEKQSSSKTQPVSEVKTKAHPKRKIMGLEPAPDKTKASQKPGSNPPLPSQKSVPVFFSRKVFSAAEIKNQTIQADMMALSTQFQRVATQLANADFTKPGEVARIMGTLEGLKVKTADKVEQAKKVISALTTDSVSQDTEATNPKRLKPNYAADEPATVQTTETTTKPEKLSISFLMN